MSVAPRLITIDGPAGSGKSSTAKAVARRLGWAHLDSGALYRALTLALMRSGVPESAWEKLPLERFQALSVGLEPANNGFTVLLDGKPVESELRSSEVTERVPAVAGIPAARARLLELQRSAPRHTGVVADGRDMGTAIFPDAPLKVFLVASLDERARRRLLQEARSFDPEAIRRETRRLQERDEADSSRGASPLRRPDDAIEIDTTRISFDEQVQWVLDAAEKRFQNLDDG